MTSPAAAATAEDTLDPVRIDALVESLAADGLAVACDLLPADLVAALRQSAMLHEAAGELAPAGLGRGAGRAHETAIRQADARWIDDADASERRFLAVAETLRTAINRRLFLGLFDFEAQHLSYPPGGFYARHLDSLAGTRNRVVSLVLYLNEDWREEHGGQLVIWRRNEDGAPAAEVLPEAGTLVLFLSEEIPHEVRPATRTRRAIAGWFRVNPSTSRRVDPAG
ncbi:MAG: 2OG-Fe(II) oxygenase [Pseudomonadota bacterium]